MVSITRDFAPPFKLIAPFFIIGSIFYVVSNLILFGFSVEQLAYISDMLLISWVHIFLLGFIMALTFAGFISADVVLLLKSHICLLIGGYVFITIMAFSYILVPMFGLAHGFSTKPLKLAIFLQTIGVILVFVSSLIGSDTISKLGYICSLSSVISYFYLIYTVNQTRARKQNDMYIISLLVAFMFFAMGLVSGVLHVTSGNEMYAVLSGWLIFVGFFGFMISGHLYKIVPFLVWYEKFSPLVGKQKVPMLADMVPVKSANFQIFFTGIGIVLESFAIFF